MAEQRPVLCAELPDTELRRWYWTHAELARFARGIGVSAAGGKLELVDRLAASLDGRPPAPAAARRPPAAGPLPEPITRATVLPAGQRCTEQLRRFLRTEIGPSFRFDGAMRTFIAADSPTASTTDPTAGGAGRTVGDVIEHWHRSRADAAAPSEIEPQFELNRFLRDWRRTHAGGGRAEALAAWQEHRARPRS